MVREFRPIPKLKGWFEYYHTPCDICGSENMCMINKDKNRVVCCRVKSDKPFGHNGTCPGYLHFLNTEKQTDYDFSSIKVVKEREKHTIRELNIAYQLMLKRCQLDQKHFDHLTGPSRCMTTEEIEVRQYNSFPDKPWQIIKDILKIVSVVKPDSFLGVPGFYTAQGKNKGDKYITMSGSKDSILIPCRDITKQIVGFQYRIQNVTNRLKVTPVNSDFKAEIVQQPNVVKVLYKGEIVFEGPIDFKEKCFKLNGENIGNIELKKGQKYYWLSSSGKENGTGVGNPLPVHLAVPYQKLEDWQMGEEYELGDTIWVTEGLLKGDRIAQKLYDFKDNEVFKNQKLDSFGTDVFSLPGVQTYRLILPIIKEKGIKKVVIAYDMDATTNKYVKMHLFNFSKELKEIGVRLYAAIWDVNESKGLDDLLNSNRLPSVVKIG